MSLLLPARRKTKQIEKREMTAAAAAAAADKQ